MEKYSIGVVTGSRAEYGLWKPVLKEIVSNELLELRLIVTGSHLAKKFGYTIDEIIEDGFSIDAQIGCLSNEDPNNAMPLATARALKGFSEYFLERPVSLVLVLGDRYETFAAAIAAAMLNIPIAHLYGGDTTEGAIDEFLRHSISKMSYLHFVSNEQSAKRVMQLGESPDRVFDVGALGTENILNLELMSFADFQKSIGIHINRPFAVVTFHPVTLEKNTIEQVKELLKAIGKRRDMQFIFTKANADSNGTVINDMLEKFTDDRENCVLFDSLGQLRYFSALRYAAMVIGNSSSGIYEAPLFGIPTINVGDRQKGRLRPKTVIDVEPTEKAISDAINVALERTAEGNFIEDNPYYKPNTARSIVNVILDFLENDKICLKKSFYDMESNNE